MQLSKIILAPKLVAVVQKPKENLRIILPEGQKPDGSAFDMVVVAVASDVEKYKVGDRLIVAEPMNHQMCRIDTEDQKSRGRLVMIYQEGAIYGKYAEQE